MKREEAIKLLKQYQGYEPMSPDGETLKHSFDLTDETVDALLTALRPVSREQVEQMRGKFLIIRDVTVGERGELLFDAPSCSRCGHTITDICNFCPSCGAPMTDEAVEMVMERLNKLEETKK